MGSAAIDLGFTAIGSLIVVLIVVFKDGNGGASINGGHEGKERG